jgi:hypothetical protein
LDTSGLVHPYPRKLGIRKGGRTARTQKYAAEELGAKTGRKPLPVGLIFVGQYRAGARFRPRRLTAGQAVLALLNHTVSARRQPGVALATLNQAVARARAIQSRRGEAGEIIAEMFRLCQSREPISF